MPNTSTNQAGYTPTMNTDESLLEQIMEKRGGTHATIEDGDNGAPNTCSETVQQMEKEVCSLKRVRDGIQSNESDDSSQPDASTVERADGGEHATISGWLNVMTRNRNKQMKISDNQNGKAGSKSATNRR